MASTAEVALRSGSARPMPAVGVGTASPTRVPDEVTRDAVLAAIEVGFRHLDTACEVFVTSKLWCHPDLVLPSLRETLQYLQMEYVDLYLIHWPVALKPGPVTFPNKREDAVPFDLEGVWRAMEECQRLGLAKAIGVSNFAYTLLLLFWVALRWIYEQGVTPIVKSNNKERLQQNLQIFDWELTDEDRLKISQIPQRKIVNVDMGLFSQEGEFTSVNPADLDIVEE
ncbi:unnamed protein product [Urochloa decumbens]|uniref:NADP-dependent oxidoreductase domain-containing protein n=1 Tax=Urochloa decumbens TaxID=240449 RepID=A0ABC9AEA6_9POAL